jgi:hypothetical protein
MRRRISCALGGSSSKEMLVSVTLGVYMAATSSASRPAASLMTAEKVPFCSLPLVELVAPLLV